MTEKLIIFILLLLPGFTAWPQPIAFPGAEGGGKFTSGGRGGKVLFVDNLNDKGPGSFRKAVETRGPRTVVFRVSGTIELEKPIYIKNDSITIADDFISRTPAYTLFHSPLGLWRLSSTMSNVFRAISAYSSLPVALLSWPKAIVANV